MSLLVISHINKYCRNSFERIRILHCTGLWAFWNETFLEIYHIIYIYMYRICKYSNNWKSYSTNIYSSSDPSDLGFLAPIEYYVDGTLPILILFCRQFVLTYVTWRTRVRISGRAVVRCLGQSQLSAILSFRRILIHNADATRVMWRTTATMLAPGSWSLLNTLTRMCVLSRLKGDVYSVNTIPSHILWVVWQTVFSSLIFLICLHLSCYD